jgi:hypothetical protein
MDSAILKMVGVAGIGGVTMAVVLYVFRGIIGKNIYPQLTKEQAYKLLNRIVVLVFVIGVLGIGAYLIISLVKPDFANERSQPKQIWGYVRDDKDQPIAGARVSLDEFPGITFDTPTDGSFRLDIPNGKRESIRLRVIKEGYQPNPCVKDLDLFKEGDHHVILAPEPRLQC